MCDDKCSGGSDGSVNLKVGGDQKSTAMAVATGVGLVAMWGAIGTIVTQMISHGFFHILLVLLMVVFASWTTAASL